MKDRFYAIKFNKTKTSNNNNDEIKKKKNEKRKNRTTLHTTTRQCLSLCSFAGQMNMKKNKSQQIKANFCGKKLLKESDLSQTE